jgi:TRAP-type C4-dicarboxylate transport system permease small subunit
VSQPEAQPGAPDSTPARGNVERLAISLGDYASLAFPLAFVLTVWEIVARAVFNSPTIWTLEIALLVSGIAYILVGPQTTALKNHISIDLLFKAVSDQTRLLLEVVGSVASMVFGAVITYSGWRLAAPLLDGLERTGSALNSPAPSVIKVLIPLAGLLWMVLEAIRLGRMLRKYGR